MTKPDRKAIYAGATIAVLAFVVSFVYARRVDWPSRPDPVPSELIEALGTDFPQVTEFYAYDYGGFIDHQWLWRIDAKPKVIALIVAGLALHATNAVPLRFWQMPPHYWPRSMPSAAEAFQSPSFSADTRGPDGPHYFMLYDKTQEKAFVWFKSNF